MLAAESIGDLRAVQSRTPLLQLRRKVLAEQLAVGIPFCLGDERPSENPKERRRNTTSLGPRASAVSTASSSLLKGWAELARVEALTVDTLGCSSQAPPSYSLSPENRPPYLQSCPWLPVTPRESVRFENESGPH
ncbi:thymic stromal lymphopoietin isoform X2 [Rattus norvegicus]|uniref:thymic stromal lymphopoietin isoform X2 n=1 Tax=Rattus norvegicus TaxID=10116 RepID=UPI002FD80B49